MNNFDENWKFQQGHYCDIERIITENAMSFISVRIAENIEDLKQATDFVVEVIGGEVAVRIRRAHQHYRDLTIRAVNRGWKTELDKIKDGFARFYLYCWTDFTGSITEYILVDCDAMRACGILGNRRVIMNRDGKTGFIAIPIGELSAGGCLVAHRKGAALP
jgi:hypothetical protein